jgi:hypothetical protein
VIRLSFGQVDPLYLVGFDLDVLALGDFIAAGLLVALDDDLPGALIDHLLAQPMAGAPVDLVKWVFSAWLEAG